VAGGVAVLAAWGEGITQPLRIKALRSKIMRVITSRYLSISISSCESYQAFFGNRIIDENCELQVPNGEVKLW
jgi:hypothetical protein